MVTLQASQRYYLEALMQQSTGPENLSVRWQLPDGRIEEPLPASSSSGTWLVPFRGAAAPPGIYIQPTNSIIADARDATFVVLVTNQAPVTYQWQQDGASVAGATAPAFSILRADPAVYNGRYFTCVVSNPSGSVTSSPALLIVMPDQVAPWVSRLQYLNETNLLISYSEQVDAAAATNTANYTFTNGLVVRQAVLGADNLSVTVTTSPMNYGGTYALVINGIQDLATRPNTIATNTTIVFCASPYSSTPVGGAAVTGGLTGAEGGFDLAGSGRDIGGSADQFQFAYTMVTGDFDYRARVPSLSAADMLAKGGLMAREDLGAGSRFAGVFCSPTILGAFFESRTAVGGAAASSGSLPVNYPDTWLRLQRVGNQFTGYGSYNGVMWQQLGTLSLAMSNTVSFGMAVCSRSTSQLAVAQFRELSAVTNATTRVISLPAEPPGPSSRRTGLAITEIMYHPLARLDGRRVEFVEIFNSQPFYEDISGYAISGDVSFDFPAGTVVGAGAYLVIAAAPADVQAVYGITNVVGPYTNNLSNNAGTVRLRNKIGAVLLEVKYDSVAPWPSSADGAGHSLVLANPSYGEGNPAAWSASDRKGGSPGRNDGYGADPARGALINEFLAHTDPPDVDSIELFNSRSQVIDLSGCFLTDDPETNKFKIPDGTIVPGRGFLAFDATRLGFNLDSGGETIYLINAANTRVLDCVRFEGQANGVSTGRYPDGAPTFRPLTAKTFGTNNSPGLTPAVIINEIMYDPISGLEDDQFVELHNRGASRVDLTRWKFTAGINYTFPSNTLIDPGAYLVVARNTSRLLTNYPNLNATNLCGNFSKSLSGKGERIVLSMPDTVVATNSHGATVTNIIYIAVNDVTYGSGGRWGQWANGGGSSLELIDPHTDNTLQPNWADSDETAKAEWANVEFTGLLDLGKASFPPDQLQLLLQGEGECLVDNVEVFTAGGTNRITNPNFSNGVTGWYFQGTHRLSGLESAGGYGGGPCLHVRASGRGDTGANRIRTVLSPSLASGNTATLRAKVRWLKGHPEILLRLHGNWLEAPGRMAVPLNLGTPGARNSRYLTNTGPALVQVKHSPVLPAAGQTVVVSATASDPDGVGSAALVYRNDTAGTAAVSINMVDDGSSGDEFARDGIYSATIPGQAAGTLIAFYVQAVDQAATPRTNRFPIDAPSRECLVRFGESLMPGPLGNYHLWLTKANVNFWASREKLSSEPVDCTFVYGDWRAVYNMGALYSGSPFHTPGYNSPVGNACDYSLTFPSDDPVLGAGDMLVLMSGNGGNDPTQQREQGAFWLLRELGTPTLYRRYVSLFVNGNKRGTILEDGQQPNADYVSEYFPDDDNGQLHKIDDWFEFNNTASDFLGQNIQATLDNFTTTGGLKKMARYRWNWRPRAVKGSANDFTNLFTLV
ncbi:MAG TPA: lamin tail domain-containing protein, partial [Verrucomicrobiae bacterium]